MATGGTENDYVEDQKQDPTSDNGTPNNDPTTDPLTDTCCCIEFRGYNIATGNYEYYALTPEGTNFNNKCVWSFTSDQGQTYFLWYDNNSGTWNIAYGVNDFVNVVWSWVSDLDCPDNTFGNQPLETLLDFRSIQIRNCVTTCPCLKIGIVKDSEILDIDVLSTSMHNNRPVYIFQWLGITYTIYFNGSWIMAIGGIGGQAVATLKTDNGCPSDELVQESWGFNGEFADSIATEIGTCDNPTPCLPFQERVEKTYESIKLPNIFTEELRDPTFKCCETLMVLADPNSTDSWRNDVTSAWIKLSDPSDQVTITLTKSGQPTIYPVVIETFVNEPNARYRTIYWRDVLTTDGEGCYKINIEFTIGGMTGSYEWGTYDLKFYTTQRALNTARIRVLLNQNQQIEDINFTDSMVEDTIRFYGFIGNRQPNMETDNLIYQNRVMRSVKRENLDTYEILTDPYTDDVLRKLTDLYLLSENEMFISDYNSFNNSYRILDIPVIVEESPEIDYLDQFQRKAKLTCIVGDKIKNKRTFY